MDSEIKRLTKLKEFFQRKQRECLDEIATSNIKLEAWRESEREVDNSIHQVGVENSLAVPEPIETKPDRR